VGSCEMQGFRTNMEDMHSIHLSLGEKHPEKSFFAVFDGHGGDKASIFMSQKLWQAVSKLDDPMNKDQLIKCLQDLDAEFLKFKEEDRENGSTAVFAIAAPEKDKSGEIKTWKLTIGNLGDSRAIVIKSDGKLESLTQDHKPERKDEETRIQQAGGFVRQNRVDGQLAMSRAIGDSKYKGQSTLSPELQKVIAVPEIETTEVHRGDKLLLYCDGIVEQMQNTDVATFVHRETKEVQDKDQDPARVMSKLIDYSLDKGSKDNMSAMMIHFEVDGSEYNRDKPEFIAGPFNAYKEDEAFAKAYIADAKRSGYEGEELMALAKKTEDALQKRIVAPPAPDPAGANLMLRSLIHSLASNLGGLPGETQEEKALALMKFLQGGQLDGEDGDGDTTMKTTTDSSTESTQEGSVTSSSNSSSSSSSSGSDSTSHSSTIGHQRDLETNPTEVDRSDDSLSSAQKKKKTEKATP